MDDFQSSIPSKEEPHLFKVPSQLPVQTLHLLKQAGASFLKHLPLARQSAEVEEASPDPTPRVSPASCARELTGRKV